MKDAERLMMFLREYAELLLNVVRAWIKIKKDYSDEVSALMNPEKLASILEGVKDEEAGKVFKVFLELASVAASFSKIGELEVDELEELQKRLERIVSTLRSVTGR